MQLLGFQMIQNITTSHPNNTDFVCVCMVCVHGVCRVCACANKQCVNPCTHMGMTHVVTNSWTILVYNIRLKRNAHFKRWVALKQVCLFVCLKKEKKKKSIIFKGTLLCRLNFQLLEQRKHFKEALVSWADYCIALSSSISFQHHQSVFDITDRTPEALSVAYRSCRFQ